jgi:hypothetical protein
MVAKWTPIESGFLLESDVLGEGTVHVRESLRLALAGLTETTLDWFLLGSVEIQECDGETRQSVLAANQPYLQANTLVIPLQTTLPIGVQLTARYLLDERGLNLEVTAQVDRPIQRIELSISFDVNELALELPFGLKPLASSASRKEGRVVKLSRAGNAWGLFADMGEGGSLRIEPDRSTLQYKFFHQPLEKGVILVGRLSLFPWDQAWDDEELCKTYERWFDSDSFL